MVTVNTVPTLLEAQAQLSAGTRYLGGGTLVMRDVNYGASGITHIVRTLDPTLRQVTVSGNAVRIGAGVTMTEIIRSPETAVLAPAARAVGGPAVRNMATVGGNLFAAHPYGDLATALLALDATVEWADGRTVGIEQALAERGQGQNALVAAVNVPRVTASELTFHKVTRTRPKGVSLLSIAVHLPTLSNGDVRVAFGAMGPTPLRAKAAEQVLQGGRVSPEQADAAAAVCLQGLAPVDDALSSAWYRAEVAPVYLKRVLLDANGMGR